MKLRRLGILSCFQADALDESPKPGARHHRKRFKNPFTQYAQHDTWAGAAASMCLQQGYSALPLVRYPRMGPLTHATARYFAQPQSQKCVPSQPEGPYPRGFQASGRFREMFVWQPTEPQPLLRKEMAYLWAWCHHVALLCLTEIAQQLGADPAAYAALTHPNGACIAPWDTSLLRIIAYRQMPPSQKDNLGMNAHTDLGLLTIGLRTAPGLEVATPSGAGWQALEADLPYGQPVVLVGDTLAALTGYAVPSCMHRVIVAEPARVAWVYQLRMRAEGQIDLFALSGTKTKPADPSLHNATGAQVLQAMIERISSHPPSGVR